MNNYDNGRNMGEQQRQPASMRYPRGQDPRERPDGRPPYDGYNRPPPGQPMRSPMHGQMGHPMQNNNQGRMPQQYQDPNYDRDQQYSPQGPYSPQGQPQNYGPPQPRGPPQGQGQRRPGPPTGRPMNSPRGPPPHGAQGYNQPPPGNYPPGPRPGQRPPGGQPMQGQQQRPQGPTPIFVSPVRTDLHTQVEGQAASPRGILPPQAAPPSPASAWPLGGSQDRAPQQPSQQQRRQQQQQQQPQQPQPTYQQSQQQRTPEQSTPAGESLHSRSHGSYASSAAIPEAWGTGIAAPVPGQRDVQHSDTYQGGSPQTVVEQAPRPVVEDNRSQHPGDRVAVAEKATVSPSHIYTSTTPTPTPTTTSETSTTQHDMLKAYAAASSSEAPAKEVTKKAPIVTTRESFDGAPPKLDVNLKSDGRGSMSSLSDLILRATKLATIIDKDYQQRPRSKMIDVTTYSHNKSGYMTDTTGKLSQENGNSEISDMLASFPPPSTAPPTNGNRGPGPWFQRVSQHLRPIEMEKVEMQEDVAAPKKGRRCCGMPVWAFIILTFLLLCAIAAAVIIPLEMFVFKGFGGMGQEPSPTEKCKSSLPCMNGGTSVLSDGTCSCICTGGFTGVNCNTVATIGCATTNLVGQNGAVEVSNVTVGIAIPRLVADASANYSLALSGTQILAKFSKTSLSCLAQNALVTFNGSSGRPDANSPSKHLVMNSIPTVQQAITSLVDVPTRRQITQSDRVAERGLQYSDLLGMSNSKLRSRDNKPKEAPPPKDSNNNKGTPSKDNAPPGFKTTDKILDFARVAVLYILQQQNLDAATKAQEDLQKFFQKSLTGDAKHGTLVTEKDAANVTIGGSNSINLVKLSIMLA